MYSKKQRLAQQFDTSVSLEVIEVILQTLAWCNGIVGIFDVEIALHYKELVAAIINLNKRKSWGLQKRWWLCRGSDYATFA
jgi:hypothetical protein